MDDIYMKKYIKYKTKYLELKGGSVCNNTKPWNFPIPTHHNEYLS